MKSFNSRKILSTVFVFWLALIFADGAAAQNAKQNSVAAPVMLHVTVEDGKGGFVSGLTAENFQVFAEKTPQQITYFSNADEPLSVGLLFDISGSTEMVDYSILKQGLARFVQMSNPQNEYFLMTFAQQKQILLDSTQDAKQVLAAMENLPTLKAKGNTLFYDAVAEGVAKLSQSKLKRRVLLVISDGFDNQSKKNLGDVKKLLRKTNVLFYSVTPTDSKFNFVTNLQGQAALEELALRSGGKSVYPMTDKEVNFLFEYFANEFRQQYTLGFVPAEANLKDKKETWRDVKVKLKSPPTKGSGKASVRTRDGYYAAAGSD
jgi:Ca-activated chloride channel family protein